MWALYWCSLQLSKEKSVIQMEELLQTALAWEAKAQEALKLGDTFDKFLELIRCDIIHFNQLFLGLLEGVGCLQVSPVQYLLLLLVLCT